MRQICAVLNNEIVGKEKKKIAEEKCNDSDKTLLSSSNFISGYRKLFPLTQAFFFLMKLGELES